MDGEGTVVQRTAMAQRGADPRREARNETLATWRALHRWNYSEQRGALLSALVEATFNSDGADSIVDRIGDDLNAIAELLFRARTDRDVDATIQINPRELGRLLQGVVDRVRAAQQVELLERAARYAHASELADLAVRLKAHGTPAGEAIDCVLDRALDALRIGRERSRETLLSDAAHAARTGLE